ncbi:sigma-70 family RNA polymerase sigma factor [Enterococcus lemanii]|uniref:RNA polymerase sigma factor n=1 Tax=Enterococcus lemanii TaxID=1159752 RepID=A0ABV9MUZ3_9ENTE|nr:RNA polymerase sigma-70 factor (ECF subfamily) [Enterococcus lemanii]
MDFEEMYDFYFREVHLYIRSLCDNESIAEEIAQETFFKALKSIHRFDGKKDIRAWLFTIAKNTYFSYYKKNHRRLCDLAVSNEKEVDHTRVDLTERLTRQEDAFTIHQFIRTMSEPYKEVFSLRVFGELSFLQIGKLFGKGDSWARVTYHRARKQIIEYMEEIENERD